MGRRILEEASFREKQREEAQYLQDMLDALQELTSLTKPELEAITMKVRRSPVQDRDTFFSVKHQTILVSAFLGIFLFLPALCIWMVG
jgi:hypothetical protein